MREFYPRYMLALLTLFMVVVLSNINVAQESTETPLTPTSKDQSNDKPTSDAMTPDAIKAIIEDLASSSFEARQAATERLSALGESEMNTLEQALASSTDLETKARLLSIVSEIRGTRLRKSIDAFRREIDPSQAHGLDAWPKLVSVIGDSRVAKLLLIEMYTAQPKLMRAIATGEDTLPQVAWSAAKSIPELGRFADTGNGLSLVFAAVASDKPLDVEVQLRAMQCIRDLPLSQRFTDPRWKNDVRKLTGAWLDKLPRELARDGLELSLRYEIPNGASIAREVLKNQGIDTGIYHYSTQVLSRFGNDKDLPLLEPWLANANVLVETIKRPTKLFGMAQGDEDFLPQAELRRGTVLFQDAALAASVVLSKQKLRDYFPDVEGDDKTTFTLQEIAVPTDDLDRRRVAIERWKKSTTKASTEANNTPQ